jgi:hypothetical protein
MAVSGRTGAWVALAAAAVFFLFALSQRAGRNGGGPPAPKYPVAMAMSEELKNDPSPEARAFRNVCNRCHGLPYPSLFDEEGWRGVGETMGAHMRERGLAIPESEAALAIEYLVQHTTRK